MMGKLIQKSPLSEQLYNLTPFHMTIAPYSSEEIDNLNNELNQAREQCTNAIIEYNELTDKYTALESDLNSQINDYKKQVEELNSQVKTMEDKISSTDSADTPVVNHNCLLIQSDSIYYYYDFSKSMSYDELGALDSVLKSLDEYSSLQYGGIITINNSYYVDVSTNVSVAFWNKNASLYYCINGVNYSYSSLKSSNILDFNKVDLQINSCTITNSSEGALQKIKFTLIPVNKTVVEIPSDTSESDNESKPDDATVDEHSDQTKKVYTHREFVTTNFEEVNNSILDADGELHITLEECWDPISATCTADITIKDEIYALDITKLDVVYTPKYVDYYFPVDGFAPIRSMKIYVPVDQIPSTTTGNNLNTLVIAYKNPSTEKAAIMTVNITEIK